MDHINSFIEKMESIEDYRKTVLLKYSIKNDNDLFKEYGFLLTDINRLSLEFKNILLEQNEDYLVHNKNEEESIIEMILNR